MKRVIAAFTRDEDAARFVAGQVEAMPDFLRLAMKALGLGFRLEGLPVERWRSSPLAFRRDFVRFFEGLALYALHAKKHEGRL